MTYDELKVLMRDRVVTRLGSEITGPEVEIDSQKVQSLLDQSLAEERALLSADERGRLSKEIIDDVLAYGPITKYIDDPSITEVMVNGIDSIYIERDGKLHKTEGKFANEQQLKRVIEKIVRTTGRRIDESNPMVDSRLPDGSRVNVIIPPLAMQGSTITIRKFVTGVLSGQDLVDLGTATTAVIDLLEAAVKGRLNVIISGGTGAGKTTTLNVLSSFIPADERIITIEDVSELKLSQVHVVRLESRPPNIEGSGEVTIRTLVKNSLRMRPDRIVVGEARGGEALDMLQAMNTGHDGSLSTVHANTPRDALSRIETLVLMAGMELPVRAIREQVSSAIDIVIQQSRLQDGSRRITHVAEVQGLEGDTIVMQDIFKYDFTMGFDENGKSLGRLKATGIRPRFLEKMQRYGVELPNELFKYEPPEGNSHGLDD